MRKAVKAVGRGLAKPFNLAVHGLKVATGRQLSRKQISLAQTGVKKVRSTELVGSGFIDEGTGVVVWPAKEHKIVKYSATPKGFQVRRTTQVDGHIGPERVATHKYNSNGKLVRKSGYNRWGAFDREYSPPSRFIGKRVRKK